MVSARLILSLKMGRWYTARQPDIFVKTVSLLPVPLDVSLRIRVGFHQSSFSYRAMLTAVNYFATIHILDFLGSLLSSTGQVSVLDNNYPKKKAKRRGEWAAHDNLTSRKTQRHYTAQAGHAIHIFAFFKNSRKNQVFKHEMDDSFVLQNRRIHMIYKWIWRSVVIDWAQYYINKRRKSFLEGSHGFH